MPPPIPHRPSCGRVAAQRGPAAAAAAVTAGAVLAACGLVFLPPAVAADGPSIEVTPSRLTVPYVADQPVLERVEVANRSAAAIHVETQVADVDDQGAQIRLTTPTATTPGSWVTVSPLRFDVPAGGSAQVVARVQVPRTAEAGEHVAALLLRVPAVAPAGSIPVSGAVAVRLYLQGPGPVRRAVELGDITGAGLVTGGPVRLGVEVRNTGTVHADLTGRDAVTIGIDGTVATVPGVVLARGAARHLEATVERPPLLCICTVTARVSLPGGGQVEVSRRIVILPSHAGVVGGVVTGAILVLVTSILGRRARARRGAVTSVRSAEAERR